MVGWLVLLGLSLAVGGPDHAEHEHVDQAAPRLLSQVTLHYPEAALVERLHDDVHVEVHVDASGVVTGARVLSGEAVFHEEALRAANDLVFEPGRVAGEPEASAVTVVFHFAPPTESVLVAEPYAEIVVEGYSEDREDPRSRVTLQEDDLVAHLGQDLANVASEVPGVTRAAGTTAAGKLIIRGHQERRLLLLSDGIRHESQKWGADHAPEIDTAGAGRITIIKGAAGVRYGPDALGGVVLVSPRPLRTEPGVDGELRAQAGANGARGFGGLRLDYAPEAVEGLSTRFEANYRASADARAPEYVLGNSAYNELNLGASVGFTRGDVKARMTWRRYDLTAGVFYGVRAGTPEDFEAGVVAEIPAGAELWTPDLQIERPYQRVVHDTVTARASRELGAHSQLQAVYSYQHNHRQEFEPVRGGDEGPAQYDFVLRTHALDLVLDHGGPMGHTDGHDGGIGLQGLFQENVYTGLPLLPNYRSFSGGVYLWERVHLGSGAVEAGGRYDRMSRTAYLSEGDYQDHLRNDTLGPTQCDLVAAVASCPDSWDAGSLSVGGRWPLVADRLEIKLDLSSASRFPNVDELYLLGTAPTLPVYGVGDPDLGVETTWGASPTLGARWHLFQAEVSAFANWIPNYIQFVPMYEPDGEVQYDVSIRGAFPRFGFGTVDALFTGVDGFVEIGPDTLLGARVGGAIVQARDRATGDHLLGIPADRGTVEMAVRPSVFRGQESEISVLGTAIASQFRVDPDQDLAPPPPGAFLLSATVHSTATWQNKTLTFGAELVNALNTTYREYNSLLRYFADQPGRSFSLYTALQF